VLVELVACGGSGSDPPFDRDQAAVASATSFPVNVGTADAACDAAKASASWTADDRSVAPDAAGLTQLLTGRWYLCASKSSGGSAQLLAHDSEVGMQIDASGAWTGLRAAGDGTFVELQPAAPWRAESSTYFYRAGSSEGWAVFSHDGAAALMGSHDLGSREALFVRLAYDPASLPTPCANVK